MPRTIAKPRPKDTPANAIPANTHPPRPTPVADGTTGDPTTGAIAGRIRQLRKGVGLTARDLDRLTDLCPGTIGRLERGDQKVYASHLYRIAHVIGVDVGWFYRRDGAPTALRAACGASQRDLERQRLLDAYMRIKDPAMKRDVFELIETLAQTVKD